MYIMSDKEKRKCHPSIDGWPMAIVLFQKSWFNRLAKILCFDVFLLKIAVGYFCCFKWV